MALTIGDKVPDILGRDQDGNMLYYKELIGKKVALYFYPKDSTPGCTAEACSLRDGYTALQEAGYVVVGVSKDSAVSHRKFRDKESLPFTLISDEDLSLNKAFGVWQEKKMAGHAYMGTVRTTFLIDEKGVITDKIEKVDTKNHAVQILNLK